MKTTNSDTAALWTVDPMHTSVGFSVRHMMVATMRGTFDNVSGSVRYDAARPEATEIKAEIAATSVHTRQAQRDAHLRSPEFFDAEKYPLITFQSRSARPTGQGAVEVMGALTLRGITREVAMAVSEISGEQRDHRGFLRIGATATTKIRRSDFGITYNPVLEAGGIAISDEVSLTFDVSLTKDQAE